MEVPVQAREDAAAIIFSIIFCSTSLPLTSSRWVLSTIKLYTVQFLSIKNFFSNVDSTVLELVVSDYSKCGLSFGLELKYLLLIFTSIAIGNIIIKFIFSFDLG